MIDAMKQALSALEIEDSACRHEKEMTPEHIASSITALRQAIEEAEKQEPVALEKVYEIIIQWDEAGGKRSRRELARRIVDRYTAPMSTKPENIDTKSGCVHEIDILKAEVKRSNELAEYRLQLLMQMPENKPWVGLDVDDIDAIQVKVLGGGLGIELTNFARAIEAKLRERNT